MKRKQVLAFLAIACSFAIPINMLIASGEQLSDLMSTAVEAQFESDVVNIPSDVLCCAGVVRDIYDSLDTADEYAVKFLKVKQSFTSFVTDFDTWCESSEQLDISAVHTITSGGVTETLSKSKIQTSNLTRVSHLRAVKPKYVTEMWYNVKDDSYYVHMSSVYGSAGYVHLDGRTPDDMKQFFVSLGGYNTTYNTVKAVTTDILSKITTRENTPVYSLSDGPADGQWTLVYKNDVLDIESLRSTFDTNTNPLKEFQVSLQYINDCLYVDIVYTFDENAKVQEEQYSYVLRATDTYLLEPPASVVYSEEDFETLQVIYNKTMKGD